MRNVNGILGLAVLTTGIGVLACGATTAAEKNTKQMQQLAKAAPNSKIDYQGFVQLTKELEPVRAKRRVPLEVFNKMAKGKNTIILDTRSKAAFDKIHWKGAVHLNFSDFTDEKLAQVIPNKKTRVLIYCNNNFETKQPALVQKRVELALNIPTFVNLHGYGYRNVYELADVLKLDDPRVSLESSPKKSELAKR